MQVLFSLRNNLQLCKACTLYSTCLSSGLPPYPGLPVAPPSPNADQISSAPITQEETGKAKAAKAPQATRTPQFSLLKAVGGEFGPNYIFPFHFLTKQIKVDSGKFSDDMDKYTDVLQGLGQSFKLDWKNSMLFLRTLVKYMSK